MEAYYKAEQKHLASSQVLATSTVRKRTAPTPVQAPVKRAKGSESERPGPSCQKP
ncbi:hypothetical protein DPMN_025641 [Dreissena polymorpha]|uniref:Uncharacterized protein n=1 Tax=Dreissena polymorpha TaxID=45954 RepID=A0A9D4LRV8_DREPO|nr:hypothetical protein DPMN_025641 [Dreissena polymorpha]